MDRREGAPDPSALSGRKKSNELSREILFLAEQAAEGGIKVVPGKVWGFHYPVGPEVRAKTLQDLLAGRVLASEAVKVLKPDALVFDIEDLGKNGLEHVGARVRDLSSFVRHFDVQRFAEFVQSMRGREISPETLEEVYSGIMRARIQKKTIDSFGFTGRRQMERALRVEAEAISAEISGLSRVEKVLKSLKADWLTESSGSMTAEERDRVVSTLSGDERQLFEKLRKPYREFIQNGSEEAYREIVEVVRDDFEKLKESIDESETSESMAELDKELEDLKNQVGPPGTPEDPAIPPEDQDEYHTPPPVPGESREKKEARPIFEIEPPLGGYYISGRKSYFDIDGKTWSKKKRLTSYNASIEGKDRHTISGALDSGLKSLPIPNGFAIDRASLKTSGVSVEIKRDQNGCFYLEAKGQGTFQVDFLSEPQTFVGPPIPEDTTSLYRGQLSSDTEAKITQLNGTPLQKAEQARQYILAHHFYPGGGDLQSAQALQHKLRSESNGSNYLQNLDKSEYLECYSANTKFIAMMRKAGVPARLVVGYKVEGSKKGKSAISESSGHAWSEIWDGQAWRRFDATPTPKPEDKKEEKKKDQDGESAPEAQDGGVDSPEQEQKKSEGQKKGEKPEKKSDSSEGMSEVSDAEVEQGESQLQKAEQQKQKAEAEKKRLDKKVQEAQSFKDLADLHKELENSEMFEDQKKEMEEKLEAKEKEKKDEITEELDKMVDDGFMDEKKRDEILEQLEKKNLEDLDRLKQQIERESRLYEEYESIREEVAPLVEKWFRYFAERLPKKEQVDIDEDSLMRQGAFNRRAVMRARNLLFGTVKNPRQIRESVEPRFMASILVDVSGSMAGKKLMDARKLLVFYSELFSMISKNFGYIRFSINIFSDQLTTIKAFGQDYDSSQRYDFIDGENSTVKVRLMTRLQTQGGTNMMEAIQTAADELNKEVEDYPDFVSAFYLVGDGGDTCGNTENIRRFMQNNDTVRGFGGHMYTATILGDERQRKELSTIFGDEHTRVAPNFEDLIEQSMNGFEDDLEAFLIGRTE